MCTREQVFKWGLLPNELICNKHDKESKCIKGHGQFAELFSTPLFFLWTHNGLNAVWVAFTRWQEEGSWGIAEYLLCFWQNQNGNNNISSIASYLSHHWSDFLISAPQRMNPIDFISPMTFSLMPALGKLFRSLRHYW